MSLLHCLDASIMMRYILLALSPKFIICHLARDITETVTKFLRERYAVDKDMYTWVSSAYN